YLKAQGYRVVFYPFILMDNGDKAWRGRITYNGADVSTGAQTAVRNFLGTAVPSDFTVSGGAVHYSGSSTDYTYRRMILHYIYLANSILVDGLRFKCAAGLEVDQQQITIAARLADTVGGSPFLQALRNGAFDGCEIQRDRAFLNSWSAYDTVNPIGSVKLFKGR